MESLSYVTVVNTPNTFDSAKVVSLLLKIKTQEQLKQLYMLCKTTSWFSSDKALQNLFKQKIMGFKRKEKTEMIKLLPRLIEAAQTDKQLDTYQRKATEKLDEVALKIIKMLVFKRRFFIKCAHAKTKEDVKTLLRIKLQAAQNVKNKKNIGFMEPMIKEAVRRILAQ